MKQSLNGKWRLFSGSYDITADVPGSFCDSLLKDGLIDDPYYRSNEYATLPLFDEDVAYERRGDQHYWAVWHDLKPFEDYYDHTFRFCSEFGFESLPSIKTIGSFAEERDLNLCSPVMEAHQKCERGTEKIPPKHIFCQNLFPYGKGI